MSTFDLDRFIAAQAPVIEQVRRELEAGSKRTHWMWFIFPQLRSLGRSPTAQHFGLVGQDEARAYLADPVLGPQGHSVLIFWSQMDTAYRSWSCACETSCC